METPKQNKYQLIPLIIGIVLFLSLFLWGSIEKKENPAKEKVITDTTKKHGR